LGDLFNKAYRNGKLQTCEMIEGKLPRKQTQLVLAWAELHLEELMADWNLLMNGEEPFKIRKPKCKEYIVNVAFQRATRH
jgi:hypothetical protein